MTLVLTPIELAMSPWLMSAFERSVFSTAVGISTYGPCAKLQQLCAPKTTYAREFAKTSFLDFSMGYVQNTQLVWLNQRTGRRQVGVHRDRDACSATELAKLLAERGIWGRRRS